MSARRAAQLALLAQRAAQDGTGRPTCPPELRAPCCVWQWLADGDERRSVAEHGMSAPAVLSAWRRWNTARREHARARGVPEMQACGPTGRPTLA